MYEVEVKVRADHAAVRDALAATDATPQGTVTQADTYYDAPHRDFATTDEALRLRRERGPGGDETTLLTYKGPLVEEASKTREEHETAVASGTEAAAILDGLGFAAAAEVRKERERFALRGYVVLLDAVEGLGEFVEVETEVDDDVEAAREGARDLLRALGLDPSAHVRRSYLGLLLDAREE